MQPDNLVRTGSKCLAKYLLATLLVIAPLLSYATFPNHRVWTTGGVTYDEPAPVCRAELYRYQFPGAVVSFTGSTREVAIVGNAEDPWATWCDALITYTNGTTQAYQYPAPHTTA